MDLPAFIRSVGVDKAAKLFDEKPRAVKGWLYRERMPRHGTAMKIVERTKGKVTLQAIYGAQQ